MEFFLIFVVGIFLFLNAESTIADYVKSDELTLRNQLLADVYFLKEGVDRLLISSEILDKRFSNQVDILKSFQIKLNNDNTDSAEKETSCDKISSMFNATWKKQNILETRLVVKLEEMQENQLTNFEEMYIKLRLNKNCGTQSVSSSSLALMSTTLSEISEKIDQFGENMIKFAMMEEQLRAQQTKFDKFAANQAEILQQINDKLAKNHQQFDKLDQAVANVKNLITDLNKNLTQPRPKLPMDVILGLTSANLTSFK